MSLCRFDLESDLYIYGTDTDTICHWCCLTPTRDHWTAPTSDIPALLAHLRAHVEAGHRVYADLLDEAYLREWAA